MHKKIGLSSNVTEIDYFLFVICSCNWGKSNCIFNAKLHFSKALQKYFLPWRRVSNEFVIYVIFVSVFELKSAYV